MNRHKILGIALAVVAGLFYMAEAAIPVRISPFDGGCVSEEVTVVNGSTTSWTASGTGNRAILFQAVEDVDVYIGFQASISSSSAAVGLFNQGDSISLTINENQTVYFWGNGASPRAVAIYCK